MGFLGLQSREQRFWKWFERNSDRLFNFEADRERIFDALQTELQKCESKLAFQFGPIRDGVREFVISADGVTDRFPAVERVMAAAPQLPNWMFKAFRQPGSLGLSVEFGGRRLSADDIWLKAYQGSGKAELVLFVRGLGSNDDKTLQGAAFILVDNAVGEYAAATRIGGIDWQPLPDDPTAAGLEPLSKLPEILGVRAAA